ncbi:glutathione S-transferase kappa 1-like [Ptychodera flava]|uniref:glutathione S-transferase kappa 1-like n=1 Tax=Ptychodera flava TaxID=63121 RepID=UPI00396A509B
MAAPARKTIELFYDVISPYSWIGFETLCRYKNKWNIDLQFRPFFLGAVMHATENTPPGMNPAKGAYGQKDLERNRDYYKIPLVRPEDPAEVMFVKGSLQAQRLLTAVSMQEGNDAVENVTRQLYLRVWSKDLDITEPKSLMEAAKKAGFSEEKAQSLVARTKDQDIKDKLKENTNTALEHGAFGAPTIVVHVDGKTHMFFGSDRFHLIAEVLGEKFEGPLTEFSKL